jgi:hypothetical protein
MDNDVIDIKFPKISKPDVYNAINDFNLKKGNNVYQYYISVFTNVPEEQNLIKIFNMTQDISEIEQFFSYNKMNINNLSIPQLIKLLDEIVIKNKYFDLAKTILRKKNDYIQ